MYDTYREVVTGQSLAWYADVGVPSSTHRVHDIISRTEKLTT